MGYYISPTTMNPISRLVAAIMAVLALTGAFFFGLAVLIILLMVFSLFGLIFYLRARWLGRKSGNRKTAETGAVPDGTVIDAEYTVVSRRRN